MSADLEFLWAAHKKSLGLIDEQIGMMKKDPKAVNMIENSRELVHKR